MFERPFNPGRRPDPPDGRDHIYRAMIQREALPRPAIFRRKYLGPVFDQGQTSKCVTYTGTSVKNRQERLDHGAFPFQAVAGQFAPGGNPAANDLYALVKLIDEWPGEEGTSARYALKVMQGTGVLGPDGTRYKVGQYARLTTVEQIMEAIAWHGPVMLGLTIDSTWWDPLDPGTSRCRLAEPNGDEQGGHEVELVGYRDTTTTPVELQGFWTKGSWGVEYGYLGFHRIPFSHLEHYSDWDAWWVEDAAGDP